MMPAWLPVKEADSTPRAPSAMETSAIEIRSPAVSSMSMFARRPRGRDVVGQADQVVGELAHGRDDDDDVIAGGARPRHVIGHGADAIGVADGRAAELLNDQCHGINVT